MISRPPLPYTRAIVIGAGLTGLLAARVLVEHGLRVTMVERDQLPSKPVSRKGLPQAHHVHLLLARGHEIIERLLPGLSAELIAAGALYLNTGRDFLSYLPTGWAPRYHSPIEVLTCSRDLLEWAIRRRLVDDPRVQWVVEHDVVRLVASPDRRAITGIELQPRPTAAASGARDRSLPADLVIDASGRSSRLDSWLVDLGYPPVQTTTINAFLGYASRFYRSPGGPSTDWQSLLVGAQPPSLPRSGVLLPIEGGRWLVTLAGYGRDYPPTDEAGFLDFARSLANPMIAEALQKATPLSPIRGYRRTENHLRHYERATRWPIGLIALGDAVCAFNPVYGQGMTNAARSALLLDQVLRSTTTGLEMAFQRALARSNSDPWLLATSEDYRYPTTEGSTRGALLRFTHWYVNRVIAAIPRRPDIHLTFVQVAHLVAPPSQLFAPHVAGTVLWQALTGRRQVAISP